MFTGLIQVVGRVIGSEPTEGGRRFTVDPCGWDHLPRTGDSIAVSGCCLTVVAGGHALLGFDVVPETLAKTTIGRLGEGSEVNLEHSATPATLLGGHIVQGHVDGVGQVLEVFKDDGYRVRVGLPSELTEYATPKGSVTIEGVSLTIAALRPGEHWLEVALIPETLARTTLRHLAPGDPVNLEMDAMSKAIVHWLKHYGGRANGV